MLPGLALPIARHTPNIGWRPLPRTNDAIAAIAVSPAYHRDLPCRIHHCGNVERQKGSSKDREQKRRGTTTTEAGAPVPKVRMFDLP